MFTEILGYIGYAALLFFMIGWGLGVRRILDASYFTIFGALLYFISALSLPVFKLSLLHSFWIIPAVFIITRLCVYVYAYNIPLLKPIIENSALWYARVLRYPMKVEKNK